MNTFGAVTKGDEPTASHPRESQSGCMNPGDFLFLKYRTTTAIQTLNDLTDFPASRLPIAQYRIVRLLAESRPYGERNDTLLIDDGYRPEADIRSIDLWPFRLHFGFAWFHFPRSH